MPSNARYYKYDLPDNLNLVGDIAVDTEAMGLNNHRDRLCVAQLADSKGEAHIVHFPTAKYDSSPNLCRLLSDPNRTIIFHFARFDVAILMHYLKVTFTNLYCTKIASRLSRTYTDQHGLKDLCAELGIKISKQQRASDWGASSLSKEQIDYASHDVIHLHEIRDRLNSMLLRENRLELAQKCFEFVPTRAALDLQGWNDFDIFVH